MREGILYNESGVAIQSEQDELADKILELLKNEMKEEDRTYRNYSLVIASLGHKIQRLPFKLEKENRNE